MNLWKIFFVYMEIIDHRRLEYRLPIYVCKLASFYQKCINTKIHFLSMGSQRNMPIWRRARVHAWVYISIMEKNFLQFPKLTLPIRATCVIYNESTVGLTFKENVCASSHVRACTCKGTEQRVTWQTITLWQCIGSNERLVHDTDWQEREGERRESF